MTTALLVGLGGFLGSISRYLIGLGFGQWLAPAGGAGRFSLATFTVNVVGCALIGYLAGLAERSVGVPAWLGTNAKAFLMVGVLGGFTTFSAFGNETFQLLKRGDPLGAALYVGATLIVGLVGVWLGFRLASG